MLADTHNAAGGGLGALLFLALLFGPYFLPSIIGAVRKVPNLGSVIVINLFLGWTLIGWVVALAMAVRSTHPASVAVHNYAAGGAGGWHPDPGGRHQLRWWDGHRWTEHVHNNGINSIDPPR